MHHAFLLKLLTSLVARRCAYLTHFLKHIAEIIAISPCHKHRATTILLLTTITTVDAGLNSSAWNPIEKQTVFKFFSNRCGYQVIPLYRLELVSFEIDSI